MTQEEKILTVMVMQSKQKSWFYPPDFMTPSLGEFFVGYEASARLSELATEYPDVFENKRRGKYIERRIRYEHIHDWWLMLPDNLRAIFRRQGIEPEPSKASQRVLV